MNELNKASAGDISPEVPQKGRRPSPWSWIPTLYIAEGLPNVIVTGLSVVIMLQMGMSNTSIGIYTSWLLNASCSSSS